MGGRPPLQRLYTASRTLHRYVGLGVIAFAVWMSASGILLNHPDLIRDLAVPRWLVPPQYRVADWNRGALRCAVFAAGDPQVGYVAGTQGVWRTRDGGRTFARLGTGFPTSYIDRQTNSLVLVEDAGPARLYAGTRGGLYVCDLGSERWGKLPLDGEAEGVQKVLRAGQDLLVFTPSHVFRGAVGEAGACEFEKLAPTTATPLAESVPLVRLFFDLHSGKLWGLPGRLIYDVAGVLIIFVACTAAYLWYFPRKLRRDKRRGRPSVPPAARRRFRWLYRYHLRIGIWSAVLLFVIGFTGLFMRPPLLVALAWGGVPRSVYPTALPENRWAEQIRSALYDAVQDTVLIETWEGFWEGPADFAAPLRKRALPTPVFVMGTTVLEPYGTGGYLLGSFSGLFHQERATGRPVDMLTGEEAVGRSNFRPAELMAAGFLRTPAGEGFVVDHYRGLIPLNGADRAGRFVMPAEMERDFRLPLWNWLFELHNGRIFKDLIGPWYALVTPLGSLLFVLTVVTGVFDWVYPRLARRAG